MPSTRNDSSFRRKLRAAAALREPEIEDLIGTGIGEGKSALSPATAIVSAHQQQTHGIVPGQPNDQEPGTTTLGDRPGPLAAKLPGASAATYLASARRGGDGSASPFYVVGELVFGDLLGVLTPHELSVCVAGPTGTSWTPLRAHLQRRCEPSASRDHLHELHRAAGRGRSPADGPWRWSPRSYPARCAA